MSFKNGTNQKPVVIGAGEVLWDMLPAGKQVGGAPANFAYHAHSLGAEAFVVSRVGNDPLGHELLSRLHAVGLATSGIAIDPTRPTGTVSVQLDGCGKPTFTIHESVAWDSLQSTPEILKKASNADVICFGTLGQRTPEARAAIRAIHQATPADALRVFDINLRQHFWSKEVIIESLKLANVLKLNDEELPIVADLLHLSGDESAILRQLTATYELKAVALTKGANGSSLLVGNELVSSPGTKLQIADTVGAGDSYTAALALGLLAGHTPAQILERAHRIAAYVCTQPGAMPPMPASVVGPPASETRVRVTAPAA